MRYNLLRRGAEQEAARMDSAWVSFNGEFSGQPTTYRSAGSALLSGAGPVLLSSPYFKFLRDSFLEDLDGYQSQCHELGECLPPYRPGVSDRKKREAAGDLGMDPADVLGVTLIRIRYAREQLKDDYPAEDPTKLIRDCERDIRSGLDALWRRFARMGLQQERNRRTPKERERGLVARDKRIHEEFDALIVRGLSRNSASEGVSRELRVGNLAREFNLLLPKERSLTPRRIRQICPPRPKN
jgi:hypothetical protein